jgi:glycosyltransferase involved in cell wall biosynthesis
MYLRWLTRRAAATADRVLCISTTAARDVQHVLRLPAGRVVPIHCGVSRFYSPLEAPEPLPVEPPFILAIGEGAPRKDTALAIKGFRRAVLTIGIPHQLVIVGTDPSRERTEEMDGRIVHLPRQADEQLRALYRAADVFVFASEYEAFGLPMLEAMACGCPVVASEVGALPEVGSDAALYFPAGDADAVAWRINRALNDTPCRAAMREKGLARAASFSWDKAAMQLMRVFEEMTPDARQ